MHLRDKLRALALAAFLLPACANAATVILDCQGWVPMYLGNWEASNPDYGQTGDHSVIVINTSSRTITAEASLGKMSAPLKTTEARYFGRQAMNTLLYGRRLKHIDVNVNRVTGEAYVNYILQEDDQQMVRPGFHGTCTAARPKF